MKTARERAEEFVRSLKLGTVEQLSALVDSLELSFKEHARDQRHRCAEEVQEHFTFSLATETHRIVMNTRAPGER